MPSFFPGKNNGCGAEKGFSLLEVIVAVCMVTFVLGAVTTLVIFLTQSRAHNQVVNEVEGQGALLMQAITQTARNASSINSPAIGASGTTLSLAMANSTLNPAIFSLSGGSVFLAQGSGASVALTSPQVVVSNLSFQNLSRAGTPGIVRIQFTVSYASSSTNASYVYSKNFIDAASLRQLI